MHIRASADPATYGAAAWATEPTPTDTPTITTSPCPDTTSTTSTTSPTYTVHSSTSPSSSSTTPTPTPPPYYEPYYGITTVTVDRKYKSSTAVYYTVLTSSDSDGYLYTASYQRTVVTVPSAPAYGYKTHTHTGAIAGGVVGGIIALVAALILFLLCWRRRRPRFVPVPEAPYGSTPVPPGPAPGPSYGPTPEAPYQPMQEVPST